MKAFAFRLDQVLRWRETQVKAQQARAAAAAGRVAGIESAIEANKSGINDGAAQIVRLATGVALNSYAGFASRTQRHLRELDVQAVDARKALAVELNLLKDANRKARLLENLKETRQNRWQKEFDAEIAAFADESFLGRMQSGPTRVQSEKLQSGNRRARSSGG